MATATRPSSIFESPTGELTFRFEPSGHITCDEMHPDSKVPGKEYWCKHIQQATVLRWDAQAIWPGDVPFDALPDQYYLQIPVFPTEVFWTQVILTKVTTTQGSVSRYVVEWDECPTSDETVFLCYLNPGEGRNVIRQVIIEYMWADASRTRECQAGHHSFQAEMKWQQDTKPDSARRAVQNWSVYMTDQCLTCHIGDPSTDPSLVPPKQNNVWNS